MEASNCPVCMPFGPDPAGIARTRLFKARLDTRDQRTPGRLVISTHERIPALSEWTEDHWSEFGRFERSFERALKDALDPTEPRKLINLACYMNFAGAEGRHTHWHVLPCYRNPITLTDSETGEAMSF